jgi:broad specificity phosphatase PhoE
MRGIYLVRHGNTTYDTKVDALLNPPLDREGTERVQRTVEFLDHEDIRSKRILSSPLQRALMVADMISRGNSKVTTHNEALPWNLGDIMGKEISIVKDKLQYLKDYPEMKAPHGESYRTFYNRWSAFLERVMAYVEAKQEDIIITTHSRNINALQSIIGGNPVGDVEEVAPEASVTFLAINGVSDWGFKLIWDGK